MDWPGEKIFTHMLDIVERNLLSPIVGPWKIRREGAAAIEVQRGQMLSIAQVEADIARVKSGDLVFAPDGNGSGFPKLLPRPTASESVHLQSTVRAEHHFAGAFTHSAIRMLRKEVNVWKAVARAGEILLEGEDVDPKGEPDPDWLERWRENASSVSAERMQELWAQVLAREVRSPGALSLRALDLLKNLDSSDAAKIERLAPFVMDSSFVYRSPDSEDPRWLSYPEAVGLQELGVIAGVEATTMNYRLGSTSKTKYHQGLRIGGYGISIVGEDPSRVVDLRCFKVTEIGKEILQLVTADSDPEYVEQVAVAIKKEGYTVHMGLTIISESGETFLKDAREI
ncbi:DUF2806 domain-containing protein [Stenotrophomonas maltophilia]|nr:DUF2806 domain-containing protein [Stenotrophomonas maltophilia]